MCRCYLCGNHILINHELATLIKRIQHLYELGICDYYLTARNEFDYQIAAIFRLLKCSNYKIRLFLVVPFIPSKLMICPPKDFDGIFVTVKSSPGLKGPL